MGQEVIRKSLVFWFWWVLKAWEISSSDVSNPNCQTVRLKMPVMMTCLVALRWAHHLRFLSLQPVFPAILSIIACREGYNSAKLLLQVKESCFPWISHPPPAFILANLQFIIVEWTRNDLLLYLLQTHLILHSLAFVKQEKVVPLISSLAILLVNWFSDFKRGYIPTVICSRTCSLQSAAIHTLHFIFVNKYAIGRIWETF